MIMGKTEEAALLVDKSNAFDEAEVSLANFSQRAIAQVSTAK